MWYKNQRFGFGVLISQDRIMDDETLNERINWLELKENKRIEILRKAIQECYELIIAMVKELEGKARQVPALTNEISSLKSEIAKLRFRLKTLEVQARKDVRGVSISFGGGIPPLVLDIAAEQLSMLYKVLALAFHPDKHPEDRQHYDDLMKEINSWRDAANI